LGGIGWLGGCEGESERASERERERARARGGRGGEGALRYKVQRCVNESWHLKKET